MGHGARRGARLRSLLCRSSELGDVENCFLLE